MAERLKRDDSIRVSVTTETKERLQRISEAFGMPLATVAGVAIGQFIAQQERSLGAIETMTNKVADSLGSELGEQLKLFMKEKE